MSTDYDIVISGGGVAGLTAAAAMGSAGFSVLLCDPTPPVIAQDQAGADLRTTAFLQPAQQLLDEIGLWNRLSAHAAPLQIMRIVDAGGPEPEPRVVREFNAADISSGPFGWNLPNWLLRREIVARLSEMPNVTFRPGTGTASLLTRESEALRLSRLPVSGFEAAMMTRSCGLFGLSRPRSTARADPSPWCLCPTATACPARPWSGWKTVPRRCASRACPFRVSRPR